MSEYMWKIFNAFQKSAVIRPRLRMKILGTLNPKIQKSAEIFENVYLGSNNVVMGKETAINVGAFIDGSAPVIIEDYSRIGPYTKILTGTHNYRNSVIRRRLEDGTLAKSVKIERGCWVGMGTIILPGVTIAEGCIIASGSVVIKDTEPNGLYAGNPALRKKDLSIEDDIKGALINYG